MRKFTKIAMIFVGAVLGIFVFNLVLYANNPGYRQALGGMVEEKNYEQEASSEVTSVQSTDVKEEMPDTKPKVDEVEPEIKAEAETIEPEVETSEPEVEEKTVVDKTYHEDCGTGKGYWVITYSDGSVGLE